MLHGQSHASIVLSNYMVHILRCGHCQKLAPTWSDLAAYYNTHNKDIHIVKVNIVLRCDVD